MSKKLTRKEFIEYLKTLGDDDTPVVFVNPVWRGRLDNTCDRIAWITTYGFYNDSTETEVYTGMGNNVCIAIGGD